MKKPILTMMAFCVAMAINTVSAQSIDLEQAFTNPPDTAKAWCYWWWLNGAASKELVHLRHAIVAICGHYGVANTVAKVFSSILGRERNAKDALAAALVGSRV